MGQEFHYALQQWAGPFSTNWSLGLKDLAWIVKVRLQLGSVHGRWIVYRAQVTTV